MSRNLVVRLAGKGQYEVTESSEALLDQLNELDDEIVRLLVRTEQELQSLLQKMAAHVEHQGSPLVGVGTPSDLVIPPVDLTLKEAADLFQGEGLLPTTSVAKKTA
jgi:hypothetical protein